MKNANFIAIDFETATPQREPCQIGIVVVKEGCITKKILKLIQPPLNKYSKHCTRIHGITPEMTKNSPSFDIVWEDIKKDFEGNFIVAHNAAFDLDVLYKALDLYNIPHPIFMGTECTYQLSGMSLENACQTFNIPLCDHHDGLCDAEACANLFLKYLEGEYDEVKIEKKSYSANIQDDTIEESNTNHFNPASYYQYLENCSENDPLECFSDQFITSLSPIPEFVNKKFIITGGTIFNRDKAYQIIQHLGGKKISSISRSLDYAIIGKSPGPQKMEKLNYLQENGCIISEISDTEFVDMIYSSINTLPDEK